MKGSGQGPWQIKRVVSSTGPVGDRMGDAIRTPDSVSGQTTMLWMSSDFQGFISSYLQFSLTVFAAGWEHLISYRFRIEHRPNQGIIRLKVWKAGELIEDSGDIIDNGADSLKGGRLGVYCDSQEMITWSALSYKCENE